MNHPPGMRFDGVSGGQFPTRYYNFDDVSARAEIEELEEGGVFVRLNGMGRKTGHSVPDFDWTLFNEHGVRYDAISAPLEHWKEIAQAQLGWKMVKEEVDVREANAGNPALEDSGGGPVSPAGGHD